MKKNIANNDLLFLRLKYLKRFVLYIYLFPGFLNEKIIYSNVQSVCCYL